MKIYLIITPIAFLLLIVPILYAALHYSDSDLNNDGIVDISDLAIFAHVFGKRAPDNFIIGDGSYADKADLDNNGVVNIFDLAIFAQDFGKSAEEDLSINIISPLSGSTINNNTVWLNLTTSKDARCSYVAYQMNLGDTTGKMHSQLITNLQNRANYTIAIRCIAGQSESARFVSFNIDFRVIEGILSIATIEDYYSIGRKVELTDPPGFIKVNPLKQSGNDDGEFEEILSPTGEGYIYRKIGKKRDLLCSSRINLYW